MSMRGSLECGGEDYLMQHQFLDVVREMHLYHRCAERLEKYHSSHCFFLVLASLTSSIACEDIKP